MAVRRKPLSNRTVAALKVERDTVFWDRKLTGFGVRVYPTGGKVYIAQAREPTGLKRPRRIVIGRHDVLTTEKARQRAALVLARIRAGEEPLPLPLAARAKGGPTVADLAARYLEEHAAIRLKPGSQTLVEILIRCHILPTLGRMPLAAVEQHHVIELQHALSAHPVTANKAIKLLSHMYRLAEGWGLAPEGSNPCRAVEKYPERGRERFLTDPEFTRLGQVLAQATEDGRASPNAVAAILLLMLTGCRKSEILTLRWSDVDLDAGELRLADAKAGPRTVHLPPMAVHLLETMPRREGSQWVFPGNNHEGRFSAGGLDHVWQTVRAKAGLEDVRLHDLRHSFASRALALGQTLPVIGKLLGHSNIETTARYAHLPDDSIREAAERIAESIADDVL